MRLRIVLLSGFCFLLQCIEVQAQQTGKEILLSDIDTRVQTFKDGPVTCFVSDGFNAGGIYCKGRVGDVSTLGAKTFKTSLGTTVVRKVVEGTLCYVSDGHYSGGISCL